MRLRGKTRVFVVWFHVSRRYVVGRHYCYLAAFAAFLIMSLGIPYSGVLHMEFPLPKKATAAWRRPCQSYVCAHNFQRGPGMYKADRCLTRIARSCALDFSRARVLLGVLHIPCKRLYSALPLAAGAQNDIVPELAKLWLGYLIQHTNNNPTYRCQALGATVALVELRLAGLAVPQRWMAFDCTLNLALYSYAKSV